MLTIPAGVVVSANEPLPALPVDRLPEAEAVLDANMASEAIKDDCAVARPMRAETTVDLEKYILDILLGCSKIEY